MRFSRGFAAAVLLSLGCGNYAFGQNPLSAAGGWVEVGQSGAATRYIQSASIFHKDEYGVIWRLQDYHTRNYINDQPFRSIKYQVEYDCLSHKRRGLYYEIYSGPMATGRLVDFSYALDKWRSVPSDGGRGLSVACGLKTNPSQLNRRTN
jgi:hypothetical protein